MYEHARWLTVSFVTLLSMVSCAGTRDGAPPRGGYLDSSGRADALAGGARRIPITTPQGDAWVWTKRVGNAPRIKLLILHGGPGMGHEYLEGFDSWLPAAGIEYYHYDQLGSSYSSPAEGDELWTIPRFVDEVEQVRRALGLDETNFYLYGHSWGGMLAIEYALAHQEHLKGLVISNMMSSIPAYNAYARDVLMPQMDPAELALVKELEASGRTDDPRYMGILIPGHYEQHILRLPFAEWPDPLLRTFEHVNHHVYVLMQGPSELGMKGTLENWDRSADLGRIQVPTLTIGARHDTMDPAHMQWMAEEMPRARSLICPNGSHLSLYDDREVYIEGLVRFLRDVDEGRM